MNRSKRAKTSLISWPVGSALGLTAWGAFAFGAVYPWAFLPLLVGCALVGAAGLLGRADGVGVEFLLGSSLALVVAAIGLQLVPVSVGTIRWLSPETDAVLRRYAIGYPGVSERHALSIQPSATVVALGATVALSLLLLGLVRTLRRDEPILIARGVTVLGVVLALVGITQKAMWNGKIYGFWTPIEPGDSFGPFVNKNHYAGWMLIALPLAIGYLCGRVENGMRHVRPGVRNRIVWFSSADASETILVGFAIVLMAVALTLTMSRSGMIGLLSALLITSWFVARRQARGARRAVVAGYLVFVALVASGWTGFERLASQFADRESASGRLAIWADTWRIARKFPITGTGLDTFGSATLFYQTAVPDKRVTEAHNDYLQLLAEGGLLVCIPIGLAILAFAWTVHRRFRQVSPESTDYWVRVGAMTGMIAIAVQEIGEFSLQMPGNAVLFVVLAAIAARHSTPRASTVR